MNAVEALLQSVQQCKTTTTSDLPIITIMMTAAVSFFVFLFVSVVTRAHESEAFSLATRWRWTKKTVVASATATNSPSTPTGPDTSVHTEPSFRWWQDFSFAATGGVDDAQDDDCLSVDAEADITHFCFLVHGHRGFSKDLSYVATAMRRVAATEKAKRRPDDAATTDRVESQSQPPQPIEQAVLRHDMVVHSVCCNEGKTTDGVINGGERLVEEIMSVIRQEMKNRRPLSDSDDEDEGCIRDVTISILGNSLGGIYARYAIAKLAEQCHQVSSGCYLLDGKIRLMMNIFCTTASPHLGVSGHTFLPLPRTAEIGVAHAMGDTGKDLFRLNDLMKTMATHPDFLVPLGSFKKRICYANAFGTDFPVPTNTAAFLNKASTYPHHFIDDNAQEGDQLVVDESGLVIATLHTPPNSNNESKEDVTPSMEQQTDNDELVLMSMSLDSLGWKKVFVDVRKEVPNIALPKSLRRRNSSNVTNDSGDGEELDDSSERLRQIDRLKRRKVVSSSDVAAVTAPIFEEKLHWPVGHNMIVAFSRSPWSTYMNRGGRPLVDALAKELVEAIFTWSNQTTHSDAPVETVI